MSRRALGLALLVSVGLNAGVLAVLARERLREPAESVATPAAEVAEAEPETRPSPADEPPVEPATETREAPAAPATEPPAAPGPPAEDADRPGGLPPEPPPEPPALDAAPPPRAAPPPGPGARPPGDERRTLFPGPARVEQRLERLADHLGLAGEPRERFLAVQRRFFGDTLRGRRRVATLQRELRAELAAAEPDPERVSTLVDTIAAERLRLDRTFARMVVETRALLDPAQEREYQRFLSRLDPGGRGPGPPARRRPRPPL